MLRVNNITYSYGKRKRPVLENYSLKIEPGTICGLLGRNGAGKSTLLYLITGLLRPQAGTIDYNGFNPNERSTSFLNDVFIVPEEFYLPNVRLSEFIKMVSPLYSKFSMENLESHLNTFEMSSDIHLGQLSMGQKKRVFISFALACNTSMLILDEPTNGLDIPGKRMFRKAVINGMTDDRIIIISTHQVYDVEKIIDHVVITDTDGVILNASVMDITSKLNFVFTTDRERSRQALISLDAPGGFNIIEQSDGENESDMNLETLFEFSRQNPEIMHSMFQK